MEVEWAGGKEQPPSSPTHTAQKRSSHSRPPKSVTERLETNSQHVLTLQKCSGPLHHMRARTNAHRRFDFPIDAVPHAQRYQKLLVARRSGMTDCKFPRDSGSRFRIGGGPHVEPRFWAHNMPSSPLIFSIIVKVKDYWTMCSWGETRCTNRFTFGGGRRRSHFGGNYVN